MKRTLEPVGAEGPWLRRPRGRSLLTVAVSLAAVVMVAIALVLAAAMRPAFAADATSGISGKVVNASDDRGVPGLKVTLHVVVNGNEVGSQAATSGADGAFSFPDLGSEQGASYVISARYRGADYQSNAIQVVPGESASVTLQVYDTTTSPDGLTVTQWAVWVDREGEGFAVQQDIEVRNQGDLAYSGSEKVEGGRDAWTLPLVPGATNFQYLGAFIRCCGAVQAGSFIHTSPIPPGTSTATLRYTTPSLERMSFPVVLPTKSFSILVPSDLGISSSGLSKTGTTSDRGITYSIYEASGLAPGDSMEVTLTGATGTTSGAGDEGKSKTILFAGVAIALILIFVGLALYMRQRSVEPVRRPDVSRGSRGRGRPAPKPGRRAPVARQKARRAPEPVRSRRAERVTADEAVEDEAYEDEAYEDEAYEEGSEELADVDLLIEEIAALDLAFERGLLDEKRHRRLRSAAKARLVALRSDTVGGGRRS